MEGLFTSEAVSVSHPDRLADFCVNSVLTEICKRDKKARVGLEALLSRDSFVLGGEVKTVAVVDYEDVVRNAIRIAGYEGIDGFSFDTLKFESRVAEQSPDINQGVDRTAIIGAGDQGLMFGYACNETKVFMPISMYLAQELMTKYQVFRKSCPEDCYPDAKSQVTFDYDNNSIHTIVMAVSHREGFDLQDLNDVILENVVDPVLAKFSEDHPLVDVDDFDFLLNGTGKFVICGPASDAGVVGRKLVVDMYGGRAHIGGGSPNGKCGSKVDNSAARATRHAAKNLVAAGVADELEIQVAYCIGHAEPIAINVNTFGTNKTQFTDREIAFKLKNVYDFTPKSMIKNLSLADVDYSASSYYGMFGHQSGHPDFPWEELNLVDKFQKEFKL